MILFEMFITYEPGKCFSSAIYAHTYLLWFLIETVDWMNMTTE